MRRTTLALDERLLARVKEKARCEGRLLQDCMNELLARGLAASDAGQTSSEPLPVFELGVAAVDVGDREALYELMEER
jgi:hypothetical protein